MFSEENAVEQMVLNTLRGSGTSNMVTEELEYFNEADNIIQGRLLHGI